MMNDRNIDLSGRQSNILVIDDDADIRQLIAKLFGNNFEYKVSLARDGAEALDILQNLVPDIIISDIMMPHMDGLEFFIALKDENRFASVPFLFISANNSNEDSLIGFGLGAHDYISKPFSPRDLLDKVVMILKKDGKEVYDVNHAFPLAGSISTSNVKDVLKILLAANNYRSAFFGSSEPHRSTLVVEDTANNPVGAIYLENGNIINAVNNGEWGIESFYSLVAKKEGYLRYHPNGFNTEVEYLLNQPIEAMLDMAEINNALS